MTGPGFLCIGAQKAGTTWLYENLALHPDVWLPPVKELHYFDYKYPPPEIEHSRPYLYVPVWRRYRRLLRTPSPSLAYWLWRYYKQPLTDEDYLDLFTRKQGQLTGDITPAYATLDKKGVSAVQRIVPIDCKIVFILRNPVDRLWSALRATARNHDLNLSSMGEQSLLALAQHPAHRLRSDYTRTLESWENFGDRLSVFFYEDLVENAELFLASILEFLDVDSSWRSPRVHQTSNPGGKNFSPPEAVKEIWWDQARSHIEIVAQKVGRIPTNWDRNSLV